jgi:hypothetical protein
LVDCGLHGGPVGGGRDKEAGVAGESDQPEVDAGCEFVGKLLARLFGCGESIRRDIGGHHRLRHVDDRVRPIPSVLQIVAAVSPFSFIRRASASTSGLFSRA